MQPKCPGGWNLLGSESAGPLRGAAQRHLNKGQARRRGAGPQGSSPHPTAAAAATPAADRGQPPVASLAHDGAGGGDVVPAAAGARGSRIRGKERREANAGRVGSWTATSDQRGRAGGVALLTRTPRAFCARCSFIAIPCSLHEHSAWGARTSWGS